MKQVLPENITLDQVEVWFQDETRIGQQGSLTRIWAIKGTRPRVVRQQQFLSTYIYGAVCPQRQVGAALIMPYANSDCMNQHLAEISKEVADGHHAVVVIDQARWHTSKKLTIPNNISLLPLPAYSPELNPQENVWQWIKDRYISNRVFTSFDEIVDAAVMAWNKFVENPALIKSIAAKDWAVV